jgi:sigma-B regulation protein RsbU (phosphoserine phosphatase)
LIGRDVGPALVTVSHGLGGRLVLRPLALPAVQTPPVLRTAEGGFQQINLTVEGTDARPLVSLLWQPAVSLRVPGDAGSSVQQIDHLKEAGRGASGWISRVAICLGATVSFGVVFFLLRLGVRQFFAPLERSMHAFTTLVAGDYVLNLDDEDSERRDQAGEMARGVGQLRTDLLNLRMLQEERQRSAQQQGRLIREPLLNLARGLDDSDRDDISTWLDRLDWQGQASRSPLADLAGVLDRLTTLVSAQHQKRLLALRELALASQRDAQLAALQQELDIARQMQLSILPTNLPGWQGLNLAATIIPAKEVGGDFYDYFLLDERHLAIVIADVSGKGVPAAFFMAIARSLLKSMADVSIEPAHTITRLNDLLCEDNPKWMFVTLFYGVLDLHTGALHYVNAGHNPPLIASTQDVVSTPSPLPLPTHAGTHIRKLASGRNPALGIVEDHFYRGDTAQLTDGDLLFLYTDGFSEAQNHAQALFGDAALVDALFDVCCDVFADTASDTESDTVNDKAGDVQSVRDVAAINDGVIAVVRAFEEGAAQADDMTCLSLRYTVPRAGRNTVMAHSAPDAAAQAR